MPFPPERGDDRWPSGQVLAARAVPRTCCRTGLEPRLRVDGRGSEGATDLRRRARSLVACLSLLVLLAFATLAHASQQLGHMFMALSAAEDAPDALRALLLSNLDAYVAGATGPDIALLTFPEDELWGQRHLGDWPHYYRTGEFTMNLLDMAETPAEVAFAWGWLTHTIVDSTIHPLVNAYGGYYTGAGLTEAERDRAKARHIELELFENRHVIEIARGRLGFPERYRVDHALVPVDLIAAAYTVTYGVAGAELVERLWAAARAMEVTTESFAAEAGVASPRRRTSDWLAGAPAAVLGAMPSAEAYELLMNPLVIDDVTVVEEAGRAFLEVAYRVNDLRLYKGFADAWDAAHLQAVARIHAVFARHTTEPRRLGLPNLDLDIGMPEGETFDPRSAYPGAPEISAMLVTARVVREDGGERSPVADTEVWVEFGRLEESVWGGRAGHGSFRIPLDAAGPGPYQVSLSLSLADPVTREPYFDAGPASRFTGTLSRTVPPEPPTPALACQPGTQPDPRVEIVGGSIEGEWSCTFDGVPIDPDDLLNFDGTFSSNLVAYGIASQTMSIFFGLPLMRLTGSFKGPVDHGCAFEAPLAEHRWYLLPADASGHASGWFRIDWDSVEGRQAQFASGAGTFSAEVTSEYRDVVGLARCWGQFTLGPDDCSFSLFGCD